MLVNMHEIERREASVIRRNLVFRFVCIMDLFKNIPLHMDFEGQHRAEKLSRIIITFFGVTGFIWGYVIQQFSQTVCILGAGFLLAAIITIPPWPMFRRKPLAWQKARSESDSSHLETHSKKKKK